MPPKVKKVVSVSLGSSARNHRAELELLGKCLLIERVGTDGNLRRAIELLKTYDGQVDVLSLGGVNIFLKAGAKRFALRDGLRLAAAVKRTPVVDGFGIKDTWERMMIDYLAKHFGWPRPGQTALICSALDRWGLTEALAAAGCRLIIGDAIFALGLAAPFSSLAAFSLVAGAVLPLFRHVPIRILYPTGKRQHNIRPKFSEFYQRADILAGDFHFLHRYLPPRLDGKTVISSTLTPVDREDLRCRGVRWLATSAPAINGRSFGANVWEAICVALLDKPLAEISPEMYPPLLKRAGIKPEVIRLN
ncbi:MAG: quinate 5-dehydrogenase [Armatimonadetes bacterium]|nr:quinate 5-dehydrogenase [Armatimonadota bacterium]